MDLSELLSKKASLKKDSGGFDATKTGTCRRDANGKAVHEDGFTVFTEEHDRIMGIFNEKKEGGGGGWGEIVEALPEYCLSLGK